MRKEKRLIISLDVETNGQVPGINSMYSLGAAAFWSHSSKPHDTFNVVLKELRGSKGNPETMKWWASQQEALVAARKNPVAIKKACHMFIDWLQKLKVAKSTKVEFVAYPACFDWMFVTWYCTKFAEERWAPFGFMCTDIGSYGAGLFNIERKDFSLERYRKMKMGQSELTHIASEDAVIQGMAYASLRGITRTQRKPPKDVVQLFCNKEL